MNQKFYLRYSTMPLVVAGMVEHVDSWAHLKGTEASPFVVLGLARGGLPLAVALSNKLELPFMSLHYAAKEGKGTSAPGYTLNDKNLDSLKGKNVLIVDDIADSGLTLKMVSDYLYNVVEVEGLQSLTWVYRKGSQVEPDYYFQSINHPFWVVFPWE